MAQEDTDNPESTPETPETEAAAEGGRESAVKASARALDAAITESEDLRQKLIRWQADFQNLQRRSAEEVLKARRWAEGDFAKSLLSVLDHFDLALNVDPTKTDPVALLDGVKITYDELKKVLASRDIESFDPTGKPFDPHLHEAVMQEAKEGVEPMTVLQCFQAGYRMGDRILRPAKVKVSAS
ncbi:MAG: nucleotide exchange factor GrpE [Phycisphaerae bacterium]